MAGGPVTAATLDPAEFWSREPVWIPKAEERQKKIWSRARIHHNGEGCTGNFEAFRALDAATGSGENTVLEPFEGERPLDLHAYGRAAALAATAVMTDAARDAAGIPGAWCAEADRHGPPDLPLLLHLQGGKTPIRLLGAPIRCSRRAGLYLFCGTPKQETVARVAGFEKNPATGLWGTKDAGAAAALAAFAAPGAKAKLLAAGVPEALLPYLRYAPALIPLRKSGFRLAAPLYAINKANGRFERVPAPDGRIPQRRDRIAYWKRRKEKILGWQDAPTGGGFVTDDLKLALAVQGYAPRPFAGKLNLFSQHGVSVLQHLLPRNAKLGGKPVFAGGAGGGNQPTDLYDACARCGRLVLADGAAGTLEVPEKDTGGFCKRLLQGSPCGKTRFAGERLGPARQKRATRRAIRQDAMQEARRQFEQGADERDARQARAQLQLATGKALPPGQRPGALQIPSIIWCYARPVSLLAQPMGAGKSLIALAVWNLLHSEEENSRALVVCPAMTRTNWLAEAEKFMLPSAGPARMARKGQAPGPGLTIASYEQVRNDPVLRQTPFRLAVLDECHFVKNQKALRTRTAFEIQAERWCMMSGTPIYNRPPDLHPMLCQAFPDAFGSTAAFRRGFDVKTVRTPEGEEVAPESRADLEELGTFLRDTVMIRHTFREIVPELPEQPPAKLVRVPIEDAEGIAKEEQAIQAQMAEEGQTLHVLSLLAKVRKLVGERKIPHVIEKTKELKEPFLIFCHHKHVAAEIQQGLAKEGMLTGLVTGEISFAARDRIRRDFDQGRLHGICATMASMGVGLNLVRAQHVVFAEMGYNPAEISQAEARAIRRGQTGKVQTWYIAADGTLDAQIGHKLAAKRELADRVTDLQQTQGLLEGLQ